MNDTDDTWLAIEEAVESTWAAYKQEMGNRPVKPDDLNSKSSTIYCLKCNHTWEPHRELH